MRHEEALLVHVEPLQILPVPSAHAHLTTVHQPLDHDGGPADVRKLKLIRVHLPLHARVVNVHGAAQRAGGQPAAVGLPAQRGDCVEVGDVLGSGLDPPAPLLRVREQLEPVERAHSHRLTRGREAGGCKFPGVLVVGVIKGLRPASGVLVPQRVVEAHPAVRARRHDRVSGAP